MIYVPRPPLDEISKNGPSNSVPYALLVQLNRPVSTPPYWKYHYNDASFWVGTPNQSIPPVQMPAGGGIPFRPNFWPNNYDDASFWTGTPNRSIPETDETVGGGFPFKPPYWKYNNDDPGIWVGGKNRSIFPVFLYGNFITATDELPLPINCVMIGDQVYERGQYPLAGSLFKSIFRE